MISNYPVLTKVGVVFLDIIVTIFSFIAAVYLRNYLGLSTGVYWQYYWNLLLIIIIVWRGLSEYLEAYAGRAFTTSRYLISTKSLKKEISIVLRIVLIGCPIIYFISFLINVFIYTNLFTPWQVPKSLIIIFGGINLFMLITEKMLLYKIMEFFRKKDRNIKKVLVVGTGDVAKRFIDSIAEHGLTILGLIGKKESEEGKELFGYKVIGNSGNLKKPLHSYYIDELVVALPAKYLGDIEDVIAICDREGVPVRIVSPFFLNLVSKSRAELVHGLPNIVFLPVERNDLDMLLKRMMDIAVSFTFMVMLSPLFILLAILIKLDSPGPVFYKWKILGLHKRKLTSYKFRTMVKDADELKKELIERNEMRGAAFKMIDDPRITSVGKSLRKYSLDELPQLWSVFKGDLSLVGPRPPLQTEIEQYEGWHRRKLSVKPGITCLWQISGRNEINSFDEWMQLDLEYIDGWSLWLDMKILIKTVAAVFKGTGR